MKATVYIARRFIDFFRPGDEIPEGHYPPETLAKMVEKGQAEAVSVPPAIEAEPDETDQKVARKRPLPKSQRGKS